jgi:GDP-mannose 6-dehydrogenase
MRASVDEVVADSEMLVIGNKAAEFKDIESRLRPGQVVLDLVRLFARPVGEAGAYQGLCW